MERKDSNMVLIAIFVSRFEAIQIASMLRGYGISAWIDGEAHAAAEYISMALGGHRLTVFRDDYPCASEILLQAGVLETQEQTRKPRLALILLVAGAAACYSAIIATLITGAQLSLAWVLAIPLSIYTVPVDPKGRADYFLAEFSD